MERKHTKLNKQQIAQIALKAIKGKAELKSLDTGFGTSVSTTASLLSLSDIPQGDTDSNRNGDQVELMRLTCNITLVNSTTDTYNTYRLIFFRWHQDDTTAPTASDILQNTTSPYSLYNRDNLRAKKFSILKDFFDVTNTVISSKALRFDMKINGKIAFQATTTNGSHKIYALMLSDSSGSPHPAITYIARIWYTDI